MTIEIGGIKLNRVHRIVTLETADLILHRIPGKAGNMIQDLGRDSVRLQINGIFYGAANASKDLEALRKIYKQREAVDLVAEIVGQAYFSQVIIEQFEIFQVAGEPEQFSYQLAIAESPIKTTATATTNLDGGIQVEASNLIDVAIIPDVLALGYLPEITNPIEPLKGALEPVKAATENLVTATAGLKAIFGF
ncbi:MAG: DNA circularization N-terminal domain-containing protein [Nostoc sp.]|uniref:DNA circularization N-terminal domain-containing protein n=1 Tax=Nostoc sp. TaxID=1180 RepID=UPI002FF5E614